MAGENGRADPAASQAPVGAITIRFLPEDPTNPVVQADHVSMGQVMASAMLLDMWARELRSGQVARAAMGGLVIPQPGTGRPSAR